MSKACVVMIVLLFLSGVVGCSKKDGAIGIFASPYSVDCKEYKKKSSIEPAFYQAPLYDYGFEATVKGPAAKLAIILTNPDGKSESKKIIRKESMISNCQTITLPIETPQAGTYVLAVKTVDPEKVVWQKEISFSPGIVTQNTGKQNTGVMPAPPSSRLARSPRQ